MSVIDVKVTADMKSVRNRLTELMRSIQRREEPNRRVAEALKQFVDINFMTEGGFTEKGAWEPLAESTIEWKERRGYDLILQNTGALRDSFVPFSSNDVAGVGARPIHAADGRPPDMARFHEYGTDRIPARPMLPTREQAGQISIRIYGEYLKANLGK